MALNRFIGWSGKATKGIASSACGSKDRAASSACGSGDKIVAACGTGDKIVSSACGSKDRF